MKTFTSALFLLLLLSSAKSQPPSPFVPDANTIALWHFNEPSGSIVQDTSANHITGTAWGTVVVPGRFGNARDFDGVNDYIVVPSNAHFNFSSNQSFTIDVWFNTTQTTTAEFIRRGLAPWPGFLLRILEGRVQGVIGNREDGSPPDTLIAINSAQSYNDGNWHLASFERDRMRRKLYLFVDGIQAAQPVDDPFPYHLSSSRPLTMGTWEGAPGFFRGKLDEIRISNIARHAPVIVSDTLALWHYDETGVSVVLDNSLYANNGTAFGTTIVPGRFGNARYFNGVGDYVVVPSNGAFNMNPEQSFTVDLWFKTNTSTTGWLIRKGLAPVPGFSMGILSGRVLGEVGNREDGTPPDTLLMLFSNHTYTDEQWHHAVFIRDRSLSKLFLYVDGVLDASPMNDNFPIPLINDRVLTMGRWEIIPEYYRGYLDEVAVFKGARHPAGAGLPNINVSPPQLNFGIILVGSSAMRDIMVSNFGFTDTLRVTEVGSNNPMFNSASSSFNVPPGASRIVGVLYRPTVARVDTGSLSLASNDPNRPIVRVRLSGQGFAASASPFITSIRDIPEDQGKQVRVSWYRSVHDSLGDSLRIVNYSIWRRVGANNAVWDFIATIPAVRFTQYSYVAPTLFDSTRANGIRWSVFKVSAHTINNTQVFFSVADSGYSIDNLPPFAPTSLSGSYGLGRIHLSWSEPVDPDFYQFLIYRSTLSNFTPSPSNRIGTSRVNSYTDGAISSSFVYYYRISAADTSGNEGAYSDELRVILLGAETEEPLPTEFSLQQNHPNPFNPSTTISFDVPRESRVTIKIFDLLGREVATPVDEVIQAGRYARVVNAANLSSGIYIVRMNASGYAATRRMVLMK